jgi:hypothetical protein
MRMRGLALGQGCLLIALVLAACSSPVSLIQKSTPEPAVPPTPQALEEKLLGEMAERICPTPDNADEIDPYERYFTTGEGSYSFVCYPAMGHSVTVTLRRFASEEGAEAGFQSAPGRGPVEELDRYPVSDWEEQYPSFPDGRAEYRVRLLQVGRWLIEIRSFDDTHFLIAPDPREASVAVLQVFREYGLAPAPDGSP